MKILVIPDVHGRQFWIKPCKNIDKVDHIVFLGDYLDPYDFEHISVQEAINNFLEIIEFAKEHEDKVTLLLGNHDAPYFSKTYYDMANWHCRHSSKYHKAIARIFDENRDMFKIAHVEDDVLFTHAGCTSEWVKDVFTKDYRVENLDDFAWSLNNLLKTKEGIKALFMVSKERGGWHRNGSCIWADVNEMLWDQQNTLRPDIPISDTQKIKQVFGHSLQVYYNGEGKIVEGLPREYKNCKMLDNRNAYILNTKTFKIKKIKKES